MSDHVEIDDVRYEVAKVLGAVKAAISLAVAYGASGEELQYRVYDPPNLNEIVEFSGEGDAVWVGIDDISVLVDALERAQQDVAEARRPIAVLVDALERAQQDAAEARRENDRMRYLLAKGGDPCVYCQLPAGEMARCAHGFPGCDRADDLTLGPIDDEVPNG